MSAIEAAMAPAPSSEAWASLRRAGYGEAERSREPGGAVAHVVTSGAGSSTTRSANAASAGRCATMSAVRPVTSRRTAVNTSASVSLSRPAVGSSSRRSGASRTKARARARRCRSPAERPAPPSPRSVSAPWGSRRTTSVRPAASSASVTSCVGGVRSAEPDVLGDGAREEMRSLRHPSDVSAPVGEVDVGEVDPAEHDRPGIGAQEPEDDRQQRRLAASAGTGQGHGLSPLQDEVHVVEGGRPAFGVGDAQPGDTDPDAGRAGGPSRRARPGVVEQLEDLFGCLHAVGTGVVVGAERPQGQVGLRREHQHEERVFEGHVPTEQAQADGDRDERDRHRGEQFEDQRRQEGQAQRGHRGRPVAIGDRGDRPGLGLGTTEDLERGQSRHDVEEVPGQLLERPHAGGGAVLRGGSDERHEERDQGKADRDQDGADPVRSRHHADDRDGHDDGQEQLGQVAREVAVECVDPGGQEHAELTRAVAVEALWAERGDPGGRGESQLGLGRCRGPVRRTLGGPGQGGATHHHREQGGQGSAQRGGGAVVHEGARHDRGDQEGLGDHQQRSGTTHRDGQDDEAPGGPGVAEQPGVEGAATAIPTPPRGGIWLRRLRCCAQPAPSLRRVSCCPGPCPRTFPGAPNACSHSGACPWGETGTPVT